MKLHFETYITLFESHNPEIYSSKAGRKRIVFRAAVYSSQRAYLSTAITLGAHTEFSAAVHARTAFKGGGWWLIERSAHMKGFTDLTQFLHTQTYYYHSKIER